MCTFIVKNLLHNKQLLQADIPVFTTPEPRCNDFDLRLENISVFFQNGSQAIAGNVETCLNGTYFSICDIGWDDVEAQLICNALGLVEPFFRKFVLQGHPYNYQMPLDCHAISLSFPRWCCRTRTYSYFPTCT